MAKPIEVDFDKFLPSLQQFVALYDVMKGLGLIDDLKVEMDESNGPLILINSNITQEASNLYG